MELKTWMEEKEVMVSLLKQHLACAKLRMKKQVDQHRSERQFTVGEQVWVKLQPYVQSSLAPRANQKLSFKFFGPFPVLQRIGQVDYKLLLPASSLIHPIFHVSQLKKVVLEKHQVPIPLPDDIDLPRVPIKVLQRRLGSILGRPRNQALIQWSQWPPKMATWEDVDTLQHRFPHAPAWGQAASQEGEVVSNPDDARQSTEEANGRRHGHRPRKSNLHIFGPE
jgi:hypothetical protein